MAIALGSKVQDKVSGFEGIVTGRAEYLTGCHQCCVLPRLAAYGAFREAQWFDEQRLVVDPVVTPIALNNDDNPGCDMPAPPAR